MQGFNMWRWLTVLPIIWGSLLLHAPSARADSMVCASGIGDNVTSSTACELGGANNDSVKQVNADTMFGFGDWIGGGAVDIGFNVLQGMWSIDDLWTTLGISDLMLVFKGGNGEPNIYVGYLITPGATSGAYLSPFANPHSGNPKDISHISVYYRAGGLEVTPTPEPGTMLLLGTGLLGLVGYGWRRKQLQTA